MSATNLRVKIPPYQHLALKVMATEQGRDMGDLVSEALHAHFHLRFTPAPVDPAEAPDPSPAP